MADAKALRDQLTLAASSARVVVRCLAGGRDLQDASQRAIMLLVDTLDSLSCLKEELFCSADNPAVTESSRLDDLLQLLECFSLTTRAMEMCFQPGGVGVGFYRRHLLERTFLERLERYKVLVLLAVQVGFGSRFVFLDPLELVP